MHIPPSEFKGSKYGSNSCAALALEISVIIKLLILTALRKFSIWKAEHRGKKDTYLAIYTEINMFFSASKKT